MTSRRAPNAPEDHRLARKPSPVRGRPVDHCQRKGGPQNRETPSSLDRKGASAARPDGNEGRQNNLVIGLGSNPVHTRSSGAIRKEHQPSNTCSAGSANGDVRHVVYLYRSDRSRRHQSLGRRAPPRRLWGAACKRCSLVISHCRSCARGSLSPLKAHIFDVISARIRTASRSRPSTRSVSEPGGAVNVRNHIHQINDALAGTDFEIRGGAPEWLATSHRQAALECRAMTNTQTTFARA